MKSSSRSRRVSGMVLLAGLLLTAFICDAGARADENRPRIGLALSGGGAKGAAHVGILKRFEELNIPIDYITGTSMGSIVGGLYAAGMTADELAHALKTVDWTDALQDQPPRRDMAFRRKEDTVRYATDVQLGIGKKGIKFPPGLRSGQKLYLLLQTLCLRAGGVNDFDDLPIPFRAVATDIQNGEPVVLSKGNLARALRASMAIPSAFAPVIIDGVTLVDGGITNNLPAKLVREMGADIVIAVDLGTPLDDRAVDNLVRIYNQMSRMLIRKNVEEQLQYADLIIHPPVAHFGTMGFKSIDAILEQGYETALEMTDQLEQYAIAPEDYRRHRETQIVSEPLLPVVDWIEIEGNMRVDTRVIRNELRHEVGQPLDFERFFRDIGDIYGLGDFQQVSYRIERRNGKTGLVVEVREKPWGPNYLLFGLRLASTFENDLDLAIRFNLTLTRLNRLGAEWRNDFQLGTFRNLFSEFYQPLVYKDGVFVAGSVRIADDRINFFVDGANVAEIEERRIDLRADLGYHFGKSAELRLGAVRGSGRITVVKGVGAGILKGPVTDIAGPRVQFVYDTLDNPNLPSKGTLAFGAAFFSRPGWGADFEYDRYVGVFGKWWKIKKHIPLFTLEMGWSKGGTFVVRDPETGELSARNLPGFDEFTTGGLFSLSGFRFRELRGQFSGVARLGYLYNLKGHIQIGGWYETGNVWQERADFGDNLINAVTLFAGTDTFIGPVYLAYGYADQGESVFYLSLGQTFGRSRFN